MKVISSLILSAVAVHGWTFACGNTCEDNTSDMQYVIIDYDLTAGSCYSFGLNYPFCKFESTDADEFQQATIYESCDTGTSESAVLTTGSGCSFEHQWGSYILT
ncbi:hypothetical protein MGN70_001593 [Eutypa lata]|nr:hypothetical protein MGN70_001593 [Eutypa lata]